MSTTDRTRAPGPRRRGTSGRPPSGGSSGAPSIREVCLIGVEPAGAPAGGRLEWAGRSYRVVSRQRRTAAGGTGYVHLAAPEGAEPARGRAPGRELAAIRSA